MTWDIERLHEIVARAFDRYHAGEHDDVVVIEHDIQHALAGGDGGTKWLTGRNIHRYDITLSARARAALPAREKEEER